jgi:hypothetical protein
MLHLVQLLWIQTEIETPMFEVILAFLDKHISAPNPIEVEHLRK